VLGPGQVPIDTVFTQGQQIHSRTALSLLARSTCKSFRTLYRIIPYTIITYLLCNGWLVGKKIKAKGGLRRQESVLWPHGYYSDLVAITMVTSSPPSLLRLISYYTIQKSGKDQTFRTV